MNALLLAGLMFSPYVQPAPVEMDCVSNVVVKVDASQSVTVACGEDAAKWVESHLRKWYGKDAPKVARGAFAPIATKGDEAYELDAAPSGITIRAPKAAGVSMTVTVCPQNPQLLQPERMPSERTLRILSP